MYEVRWPNKERWIFIFCDYPGEPDEFVVLLKAYRDMVHGKIREIPDLTQYKVDNDELGLIFQWDDCFGITVIVPKSTDLGKAYNTLKGLCESIQALNCIKLYAILLTHKKSYPIRKSNQIALIFSGNIYIIPTRSLSRNLNRFQLSFIARGISIIPVVCQIWSI